MTNPAVTESDIRTTLQSLTEPVIGRTLTDLKMISQVECPAESEVNIVVELPVLVDAYPEKETLAEKIQSTLKSAHPSLETVNVKFTGTVKGKETGGNIGLKVKNVIVVGSGKGGVGKSTISACLAFGLQSFGAKVGLMDADVYGPSLPHMLGATGRPTASEHLNAEGQPIQRIHPVECDGMKLMSMGFFVEPEKAVIWRGPMLHKALSQFLQDTEWGELDYLIIDLPPGTGDVSLSLSQMLGLAGAVIVCTPQQVALLDAIRAINMYQQVNVPLLGLVENMTGPMFGQGGAKKTAEEFQIPFLGEVPGEAIIRQRSDEGKVASLFQEDHTAKKALEGVCRQVSMQIAKQLLERPSLPQLEIL